METTTTITTEERAAIEQYARKLQLEDLDRFTDDQVYLAFVGEFDLIFEDKEEPITHLLFDMVTMTADSNPVDTDYWIIKLTHAGAIAQIIREAVRD